MVSFSKFIAELNAFIFVSFCLIKIIKVDFRTIERHTKESFWLYFELFLFFALSKIEVEILFLKFLLEVDEPSIAASKC